MYGKGTGALVGWQRRSLRVVVAAVLVAAVTAVLPGRAAADDGVRVDELASGAVRMIGPGYTVAGGAGLRVEVSKVTDGAGGEHGSISVNAPAVTDPRGSAEAYQRSGRTPYQDAVAAGVNPTLLAKMAEVTAAYGQPMGFRSIIDEASPQGAVEPQHIQGGGVIHSSL